MVARTLVALACLVAFGCQDTKPQPEQAEKKDKGADTATHVVTIDAEYYTSGPQQGRPPDGTLKAGTKVTLVEAAGSYTRVRTPDELVAFVASDALQDLHAAGGAGGDVATVARGNNEFACNLYKELRGREGNLFLSPSSISTALAMTYAGAGGETAEQMEDVLHFSLLPEDVHQAFATLVAMTQSGKGHELTLANRLWAQKDYAFQPEFLDLTADRYGAGLEQVDFQSKTEESRLAINDWVKQQTEGKIEDLLPEGVLDSMTRLVLTNAIYFKGKWKDQFHEKATKDAPFHVSANKAVDVPLMQQKDDYRYAATDQVQVLELPYEGDDLSMIVVLPKEAEGLAAVEGALSVDALEEWLVALASQEVNVFLPRFKTTAEFQLADTLRAMGMPLAFSDQADFSGMSSVESLMLTEVIHKAFVDVNEEGTEAAAATGGVFGPTSAPLEQEPIVFRADHPFLFMIRDNRTGSILFLGRYVGPQQ
jgi:serpin B